MDGKKKEQKFMYVFLSISLSQNPLRDLWTKTLFFVFGEMLKIIRNCLECRVEYLHKTQIHVLFQVSLGNNECS